jgi:hypothetical protein
LIRTDTAALLNLMIDSNLLNIQNVLEAAILDFTLQTQFNHTGHFRKWISTGREGQKLASQYSLHTFRQRIDFELAHHFSQI